MKQNSSGRLSGGCLILWGLKVAAIVDLSAQPMTFRYLTWFAPPISTQNERYASSIALFHRYWLCGEVSTPRAQKHHLHDPPHHCGIYLGTRRGVCVLFSITADPWQRYGRVSLSTSGRLKYRYTNIIFSVTAEEIHCLLSPAIQRWSSLYQMIFSIHG